MISIVIPLYNKELSIKNTICTVLNQTYKSFEIVIVDDGSNDGSANVVKDISDSRIRLIQKKNGGVSSARNVGIKEASYDWIAFLDADDLWHKDYLTKIVEIINCNPEIDCVTTDYATANKYGKVIKEYVSNKRGLVNYFEAFKDLGWHIINMSTFCVKKNAVIASGMFPENMTHGEDLEVFENVAKNGEIWIIDEILSFYVVDAENRAMNSFPNVYKTQVYHIKTNCINTSFERYYYKTRILMYVFNFFMHKKIHNAFVLFKKHYGFISFIELAGYFIKRFKEK
ncbi:glycosyltransferase involved in cell wall biosynthesis [Maribacter vaceletii]|uniref:Glycosyltransferase involved in cell wall biosynthesis n=1 Tax=Maribacter vaceletii TaxID=1206816 RepID=A0A495DSR2_9FLAO|nr:glycosyltransferase family 2 protein [Maribacter vaceletii]RKR07176.1 glycosyltransferase involved in cell wall biosynthesis [Maribacter vaceletii]